MIDHKFDEPRILQDIKDYIDSTYGQHYASGRIQTAEFIMSHMDSNEGFKMNILKYVTRYGHKKGHNRDDLMKAIHNLIFMLCYHDRKAAEDGNRQEINNILPDGCKTYSASDLKWTEPPKYYEMTGPVIWNDKLQRYDWDWTKSFEITPVYELNAEDSKTFTDAIVNPPEPNQKLKDLFKNMPEWDETFDTSNKDYARDTAALYEAECSIQRLESTSRLKKSKFISPGVSVREID